jgi:hypothetical protein
LRVLLAQRKHRQAKARLVRSLGVAHLYDDQGTILEPEGAVR